MIKGKKLDGLREVLAQIGYAQIASFHWTTKVVETLLEYDAF